tara:strand:- start:434 stop:1150 length:717 start_codon:yes stop_codon:yes gene_type:complete
MKLAIMQPYFFPYIGYFQLMNVVDKWVVFDNIQYIRHGWVNRNRILSPNLEKEWQYILIPLDKHAKEALIYDIKIINSNRWKDEIIGKLSYYKRIRAPYYYQIIDLVQKCFDNDINNLLELNIIILKNIADYLDINFNYSISSKEKFDYTNVTGPGDWALEISKQMNASLYINPIGGEKIFNRNKFENSDIEIKFIKPNIIEYKQSKRKYVPWLSIVDVLMFNSIDTIIKMLSLYKLY